MLILFTVPAAVIWANWERVLQEQIERMIGVDHEELHAFLKRIDSDSD